MRCRAGDLAVVVAGLDLDPPRRGAIVRVARISHVWPDSWALDPPCIDPADGMEIHVPDHHLRPIRPQPDDAVDEMVERVGKPESELV